MIEFQMVSKHYGKKSILENVQLTIKKGEIVGLMGESGSGKSTLARLLVGLEQPSSGSVLIDGKPYRLKKNTTRVQLIFQDVLHAVNPLFTVKEILEEATSEKGNQDLLIKTLEKVGLDATALTKTAKELSGGQLQRVCIARALLTQADIFIFDEALSGLDPVIQKQLLQLLYQLKEQYHYTYLFISHQFAPCYAICNRVVILEQGQIIEEITNFTLPIKVENTKTTSFIPLSFRSKETEETHETSF